nr:hypothetical protein [Gemmatimonadales bacterium]
MQRSWLLPFVLFPVFAACAGSRAAESPAPARATTAPITPADLRLRASIFAHDSMEGRQTGALGNVRG